MAEGITRFLFKDLPSLTTKSAGLYAVRGASPSKNAVIVCERHGIDIRNHRAQPLTHQLLVWADLVFCMEHSQKYEIMTMGDTATQLRLMGEGVPDIPDEIPDPYGGDLHVYEEIFYFLTQAIEFHLGRFRERRRYDRKTEAFG